MMLDVNWKFFTDYLHWLIKIKQVEIRPQIGVLFYHQLESLVKSLRIEICNFDLHQRLVMIDARSGVLKGMIHHPLFDITHRKNILDVLNMMQRLLIHGIVPVQEFVLMLFKLQLQQFFKVGF